MVEVQTEELIDLFGSFLFLIVAILFLYQTKRKYRNTPTLTYGFFLAFFGQFFNSITLILINNGVLTGIISIILQIIFITALNLILVFFWIFLERTYSTSVNSTFVVLVSITGTAYLFSYFFGIILNNFTQAFSIGNLIFTVLLNIVAIRSVYIQYKIFHATDKEKIALFQLIALMLIWIWAFLGLVNNGYSLVSVYNPLDNFPELIVLIGDISYFSGLLIFILTILIKPDYIYRLPLNIQDLVVFSKLGFAVYGIGTNAKEKSLDEQLLAGFITAANNFVNEMIPDYPDETIQYMQSSDRLIRLQFGKQLGVCIVTSKENWFLLESIDNLVEFLEDQNPEKYLDMGQFFGDETMREWLKMFFPYLNIDEMQTY